MLNLLLDEHISPKIAERLAARRPELSVQAVINRDGGQHLGDTDSDLLRNAHAQRITLVTYDLRTIALLLKVWAEQQISHGGVVFVDTRTYRANDVGGLVTALESLWMQQGNMDWQNRVVFLSR